IDENASPVRAGLLYERLARYSYLARRSDASGAAYERAMALIPAQPPSEARARVLAALAQYEVGGRNAEPAALAREAVERATALGARGVEANARATLGSSIVWCGEIDEALASIERAFAVASARDDIEEMARAAKHRTVTLLIADRLAETASAGRE